MRIDKDEITVFETKILKTIEKNNLIENGDKIVLGVSGGPDSMCMLNVLIELITENKIALKSLSSLVVCHINHMIREEAKEDEEYVENFCKKNGIEFFSKSIDIKKIANNNKAGLEETGREARYEFFDEIMEKTGANKIAIAHNKNDKVETLIMNALRGSGISGLKGIEVKRGKYIRPLIECERIEIENYCEEKNLNPHIDKTNFDNIYTRNKIRNVVVPYVKKEFNPNIISTLNRLSELVSEEDEYIEKQVKKEFENVFIQERANQTNEIILDLKKFNVLDKVIKSRLILYTISRLRGNSKGIEKVHIDDVITLCNRNIGNKFLTPNKNIKILIKNHKIYFISQN